MLRLALLTASHAIALAAGVALGIYLLPILTAPESPDADMLEEKAQGALYTAEFTRDRRGSDFLHWGEGKISITPDQIVHEGELAPGPDYKLYLLKSYVEHEDEFTPLKSEARLIGDVKESHSKILGTRELDPGQMFHDRWLLSARGERGTAEYLAEGITYEMAGKTGTAQVIGIAQGEVYNEEEVAERHRHHGLFIAFAPIEAPTIAVAIIVENGGGSSAAAPIARDVIDTWLEGDTG